MTSYSFKTALQAKRIHCLRLSAKTKGGADTRILCLVFPPLYHAPSLKVLSRDERTESNKLSFSPNFPKSLVRRKQKT